MKRITLIVLVASLAALFFFSESSTAQRRARSNSKPKYFSSCEACNEALESGNYTVYEPTSFTPLKVPRHQYERELEADQCVKLKTLKGWQYVVQAEGTVFFFDNETDEMKRRKDCGNGARACPAEEEEEPESTPEPTPTPTPLPPSPTPTPTPPPVLVACPVTLDIDPYATKGQRIFGKPLKLAGVLAISGTAGYLLDNDGNNWDGAGWSMLTGGGINRGINAAKAQQNRAKVTVSYIDGRPTPPRSFKIKKGETRNLGIPEYPGAAVVWGVDRQVYTVGLPPECSDRAKARGAPWWFTPAVIPDRGGGKPIKPGLGPNTPGGGLGGGINP